MGFLGPERGLRGVASLGEAGLGAGLVLGGASGRAASGEAG